MRNVGLDAEVQDLKRGYDAIEERARYHLGMIRRDEVFVQIPRTHPADNGHMVPVATTNNPGSGN